MGLSRSALYKYLPSAHLKALPLAGWQPGAMHGTPADLFPYCSMHVKIFNPAAAAKQSGKNPRRLFEARHPLGGGRPGADPELPEAQ